MKIIKQFLFAVTILFCSIINAQNNWAYEINNLSYKKYFNDTLGIKIIFPKKFKSLDINGFVGFKVRKDKDKHTGSAFSAFFLSHDKNCMIAFPYSLYGFTFNLKGEKKTTAINQFYFAPKSQVISEIKISLGLYDPTFWSKNDKKDISFDLYNHADFVYGKQAREKYNANAYSISDLPNAEKVYFFGQSVEKLSKIEKYPHCTSLFIQRDEKGFEIKFFFTEKGFKKKEKYIKMLDKHIWFDENFKPN